MLKRLQDLLNAILEVINKLYRVLELLPLNLHALDLVFTVESHDDAGLLDDLEQLHSLILRQIWIERSHRAFVTVRTALIHLMTTISAREEGL